MAKSLNIGVVGAGIGGLAAALHLDPQGHRVSIIERFVAAQPVGSGLMLQPVGLAVLADLGLADAILQLGQRIDRLQGADCDSGRTVLNVAYRNGDFAIAVHRAALFNTLRDAVARAGITIQTASEVSSVHDKPEGTVLARADGSQVAGPFDVVIDAAGANSPLSTNARQTVPLAYGAFWATVDWPEDDRFDAHALQQRYKWASVMIGVLPIGRHEQGGKSQAAFFWSLKRDDVPSVRARGIDEWKRRVRSLWAETEPLLDQIRNFDHLAFAAYGHHTLKTPAVDRIFHIGDSAHATSPQLGQGANMALLDASAVAYALKMTDDIRDAGRAYTRMRRNHVRLYQTMSRYLTPFYQSDSTVIPLARDTLVSTVARVPPMPAMLASLVSGTLIDPLAPIGLKPFRASIAHAASSATLESAARLETKSHETDRDRDDPSRRSSEHSVGGTAHG